MPRGTQKPMDHDLQNIVYGLRPRGTQKPMDHDLQNMVYGLGQYMKEMQEWDGGKQLSHYQADSSATNKCLYKGLEVPEGSERLHSFVDCVAWDKPVRKIRRWTTGDARGKKVKEEWKRGSNTRHLLREDQGASVGDSVQKRGEVGELKL